MNTFIYCHYYIPLWKDKDNFQKWMKHSGCHTDALQRRRQEEGHCAQVSEKMVYSHPSQHNYRVYHSL